MTRAPSKRRSEAVLARFGRAPSPVVAALLAAAPIGLPTLVLAYLSITAITDRLGHPGAALDDSFIHFQYARAIADGPWFAHGITKTMMNQEWAMGLEEMIESEAQAQAICMATGDFRRAFEAFAGKRKPVFEGD